MMRLPTRRKMILDAISLGANTSERIAELLGATPKVIQSHLTDMAARKQIRRAGARKEKRRGPSRNVWEVA